MLLFRLFFVDAPSGDAGLAGRLLVVGLLGVVGRGASTRAPVCRAVLGPPLPPTTFFFCRFAVGPRPSTGASWWRGWCSATWEGGVDARSRLPGCSRAAADAFLCDSPSGDAGLAVRLVAAGLVLGLVGRGRRRVPASGASGLVAAARVFFVDAPLGAVLLLARAGGGGCCSAWLAWGRRCAPAPGASGLAAARVFFVDSPSGDAGLAVLLLAAGLLGVFGRGRRRVPASGASGLVAAARVFFVDSPSGDARLAVRLLVVRLLLGVARRGRRRALASARTSHLSALGVPLLLPAFFADSPLDPGLALLLLLLLSHNKTPVLPC
jgi:hypothetical protein